MAHTQISFTMTIASGDAAVQDGYGRHEVSRALQDAARKLETGTNQGAIYDTSGNRIGHWAYGEMHTDE